MHLIDSSCKIRHITSTVQHSIPTISFVTAHFQIAKLLLSKCKNLISANKSRAKQAAIISLSVLPREVLDSTTRQNIQFITICVQGFHKLTDYSSSVFTFPPKVRGKRQLREAKPLASEYKILEI